jgi:hypothetical protein
MARSLVVLPQLVRLKAARMMAMDIRVRFIACLLRCGELLTRGKADILAQAITGIH